MSVLTNKIFISFYKWILLDHVGSFRITHMRDVSWDFYILYFFLKRHMWFYLYLDLDCTFFRNT